MNIPDSPFLQSLVELAREKFNPKRYGDLPRWQSSLKALPAITPSSICLDRNAITIGSKEPLSDEQEQTLKTALMGLHPWRKGPFDIFGTVIDTEWRSDIKWDRLKSHIEPLEGKNVLDVGCGSGYHCWRMRGAGAKYVVGIEPTLLFIIQFQALQKYIQDQHVQVLPLKAEDLPPNLQAFHTTFSMGVLYHRRSPMDHLLELKETLKPGGQLVLETLVIDGKAGDVLVPEGRYGKMGNVWFIPSPDTLSGWLKKVGFESVRCVDVSTTSVEEQRATEWMTFQSLSDFLDPDDNKLTIEGLPAPKRAIFVASKPGSK